MKWFSKLILCLTFLMGSMSTFSQTEQTKRSENPEKQSTLRLFYDEPAQKWTDALPIGNGRIGAMVYGQVAHEHIQFNEETLWTGEPHDYAHPDAYKYLSKIRKLLTAGQAVKAQELATEHFMSLPLHQKAYQPFGDLYVDFKGQEGFTSYLRELNLEEAICKVSYYVKNVKYDREYFVSYPDQVFVAHYTADQAKKLQFDLFLDAIHQDKMVTTQGHTQTLTVHVKDGALYGVAKLKLVTDGTVTIRENKLTVADASQATIYISAATNYVNYHDVSGDASKKSTGYLEGIANKSFDAIKTAHVDDYKSLFDRFTVNFGDNGRSQLPTNMRLYSFWNNPDDPQLLALYIQYARYLMISCSREGTYPATLQGIWNDKLTPPWESKYTVNINTEMNYWAVELTNLSACHQPLFKMIRELTETGHKVAKEQYDCDGWMLHHNTDIWRGAAPINASNHGIWQAGGAWLTTHLWEHYLFTQDKQFLQDNYDIIKGSALFYSQNLYKDPITGTLISSPSNSPEIGGLVAGPTMDHEIIRALFHICIDASKILDTDQKFAKHLQKLIPQIAPFQIGQHGQLQEWMQDIDDPNIHHRHVSHLWAVYPGHEINYDQTPDLMDAAKQSLRFRGDGGTGWSLAWKINYWARFLDGNHAYMMIHNLLSPAESAQRKNKGGTYPNLFDAHPPFQIDGNFGGSAGMVELLIQSQLGYINLLPALPDALPEGEISGVCARGGFELSFAWADGALTSVEILSKAGQPCQLKYKDQLIHFDTQAGERYRFNGRLEATK